MCPTLGESSVVRGSSRPTEFVGTVMHKRGIGGSMSVSDGDVVRGVLSITMENGDIAKNVFTWLIEKVSLGDWSDSEIATFIEDAIEVVFDTLEPHIHDSVTFDTVDIYKRSGIVWDYLTTIVSTIVSTNVSSVLAPGDAALMTAYTALNRVFGRKFIYGVTEADLTDGAFTGGFVTELALAAAEYISSYSDLTMGPLDFLHPGVWSSKIAGFVPFGGVAVVKNTVSYQRRRKTGVGV